MKSLRSLFNSAVTAVKAAFTAPAPKPQPQKFVHIVGKFDDSTLMLDGKPVNDAARKVSDGGKFEYATIKSGNTTFVLWNNPDDDHRKTILRQPDGSRRANRIDLGDCDGKFVELFSDGDAFSDKVDNSRLSAQVVELPDNVQHVRAELDRFLASGDLSFSGPPPVLRDAVPPLPSQVEEAPKVEVGLLTPEERDMILLAQDSGFDIPADVQNAVDARIEVRNLDTTALRSPSEPAFKMKPVTLPYAQTNIIVSSADAAKANDPDVGLERIFDRIALPEPEVQEISLLDANKIMNPGVIAAHDGNIPADYVVTDDEEIVVQTGQKAPEPA